TTPHRLTGERRLVSLRENEAAPRFSATLGNLLTSLGLLLANSLAPSWQAPDTLGELLKHSWQVLNHIIQTPA
ncbi:hypothetical protein GW17_00058365, partial [Ensete ventricosum]